MESSESDAKIHSSEQAAARKPPCALVLINRAEDGIESLSLEPEDLRLLSQVLNWTGYRSVLVDIDDDVDHISDAVELYKPTIILNLVEHMFGDPRQASAVAGMLDLFGYVYTGSEPSVLLDCADWSRTAILLEHAGLPLGQSTVASRRVYACVLGNEELESLPLCEEQLVDGEIEIVVGEVEADIVLRVEELSRHIWKTLGLRDMAQIEFVVSRAGRVSIAKVVAAVDLFGTVFKSAAAARSGGLPGTIVRLCHLCHGRMTSEELLEHPIP